MGKNLPPRVFLRGGRYYHVHAEGKRRVWKPLTRQRDGLPALYAALAQLERQRVADDRMAALIADWQLDVMPRHAEKTQRDDIARCRVIGEAFAEFRAGQVRAPDVAVLSVPVPRTGEPQPGERGHMQHTLVGAIRARHYAAATINRSLGALKHALRVAWERGQRAIVAVALMPYAVDPPHHGPARGLGRGHVVGLLRVVLAPQ